MPNIHLEEEKLYYSIGEVAKAFGEATSVLRFWEKEFNILNPQKGSRGKRKYSKSDIETIKEIYFYVREQGFTISGAKLQLSKGLESTRTTVQRLEWLESELLSIKEEVKNLLDMLDPKR